MSEFQIIEEIIHGLGQWSHAPWTLVGPGDDAAVLQQDSSRDHVASIDTLIADVHFPAGAPAHLVGYRAMMVSISDLAAMAAEPRYCLVALTLPELDRPWVKEFSRGVAQAASDCEIYVCGGNLARGSLSITISVHGEVPNDSSVLRSGAKVGDRIMVSGPLGGAAACVRMDMLQTDFVLTDDSLNGFQSAYFRPQARLDLVQPLRIRAHSAIDLSDGLLQDLHHVLLASEVGADIDSLQVPLFPGADLEDALFGGDDYELLATASESIAGFVTIGEITSTPGIRMNGEPVDPQGYDHFPG